MSDDVPENYRETVPDDVDMSQEEWEDLSYHGQYYYVKEGRQESIRSQEKERIQEKRETVQEIKEERGCINCDESNGICLDWHHIGEKEANVSTMVAEDYSLERIEDEIEECVVICSNCHRKLHAGEIELDKLL